MTDAIKDVHRKIAYMRLIDASTNYLIAVSGMDDATQLRALASMAVLAQTQHETLDLALSGGGLNDAEYRTRIIQSLEAALRNVRETITKTVEEGA